MKRRTLLFFISAATGVILFVIWYRLVDIDGMLSYIKMLRPSGVALAGFLYLLSYFLRSWRWRLLLRPVCRIGAGRSYLIMMTGNFLNYLIPIRLGEFSKGWFIKKTDGTRISSILPSVFLDKLFDSLGILVVLSLLPFLPVKVSHAMFVLILMLLGVLLFGVVILVAASISQERVVRLLHRVLFFIPRRYEDRLLEYMGIFVKGIGMFRGHAGLLPATLGLTLAAVVMDSVFFYTVFQAFSQQVPFGIILFGYTLIYLSYILPHPPAQIGSNEVLMVMIFSVGLGLDKEMVSAVMVFAHLYTGLIITGVGLMGLSILGFGIIRGRMNEEED